MNILWTVTPNRIPPVVADIPTASQEASRGCQGLRRNASHAEPNTRIASTIPLPMANFQDGKLVMGMPGGYFSERCTESNNPQYPPTVPSSWRFQGWS